MLTDTEKAALVERLAEAIFHHENFHTMSWKDAGEGNHSEYRRMATACLPIIERLLAERSIDALLDGFSYIQGGFDEDDGTCWANIWVKGDITEYDGIGPTRTAAIQAAVKAAKEATP